LRSRKVILEKAILVEYAHRAGFASCFEENFGFFTWSCPTGDVIFSLDGRLPTSGFTILT
jgi:hypothetical protein